ncbi:hypothetical protein PQ43W_36 [Ralstonia phage PQ43W]
MPELNPVDYQTLPLEALTVTDLTDALGVLKSADLLETSARAIYTIRNTNVLSTQRILKLIDAVRADEATCRQRLVIKRNMQKARRDKRGY